MESKFGLSRKTNVAMTSAGCFTAVGSIGVAVDWKIGLAAIIAALIIALVALIFQFILDYEGRPSSQPTN